MPETVVLLHGFSGTRRAWDGVREHLDPERYRPLALDLPGHGAAGVGPGPITIDACVERVLAQAPETFALAGYSLGGRVALHVGLAAPERVSALTLIGADPGIEDSAERAGRMRADEQWARALEEEPFEQFIERWRAQAVFAGEPAAAGALARADQRRNDPLALAAAMRGLSTGAMQPLWERLGELAMPVRLVAGDRDAKFLALARRARPLLADGSLTVLAGGHALHLENPGGVARALEGLDAEPRA